MIAARPERPELLAARRDGSVRRRVRAVTMITVVFVHVARAPPLAAGRRSCAAFGAALVAHAGKWRVEMSFELTIGLPAGSLGGNSFKT